MRINEQGIALMKHFEAGDGSEWYPQGKGVGRYLDAYLDTLAKPAVWTIGYGHTGLEHNDGTVYEGRSITKQEAENLLRHDLRTFEKIVSGLVEVPLNENQFSALVSFTHNVGGGNLKKSSLLKLLNAGDYEGAAEQFRMWRKAGGKVHEGLVRRRQYESALFLQPVMPKVETPSLPDPKPLKLSRTIWATAAAAPGVAMEASSKVSPDVAERFLGWVPEQWRMALMALAFVALIVITYARVTDRHKVDPRK
jgi:lysozyme